MSDPENKALESSFSRAIQLHQMGQLQDAQRIYSSILSFLPSNEALLGLIGTVLTQQGRHGPAVAWLKRALCVNAYHVMNRSNLGNALRDLDRYDEAIASLKIAVAIEPSQGDAFLIDQALK